MSETKSAFILGAGFSKDVANLPILSDLSKEVFDRRKTDLPLAVLPFLDSIPKGLWHDVESLLTYLYSGLPWSNAIDSHLRAASFHALTELICRLIEKKRPEKSDNEDLKLLLSYWQEMQSPVVTFNYDVVVEKHLWMICQRYPEPNPQTKCSVVIDRHFFRKLPEPPIRIAKDGEHTRIVMSVQHGYHQKRVSANRWKQELLDYFNHTSQLTSEIEEKISGIDSDKFEHLPKVLDLYRLPIGGIGVGGTAEPDPKDSVFPYYKLHGSIDWLYSGLHEIADEPIYYKHRVADQAGLVPVIIPPVLDKNSFYKNASLKIQWQNALSALQDPAVNTFYFVGYSLPPTDMVARYLFQDVLKNKKDPIKILIVNQFEDEEKKRQLLGNYLAAFTKLSAKQIAEEIKKIKPSNEQLTPLDCNATFDWSLCRADSTNSTVHDLVENLRNQAM